MTTNAPFFSIVIPTYNRAHLVSKTIATILQQQFNDYEVLIVDDGSKDNTEEVVKQFTDPRIQYFKKENAERGAARNFGTDKAKGVYINFFDSDDLMYPNHLGTAKQFIEANSKPEIFHLGYDFKNIDGEVTKKIDNLGDDLQQTVLFDNLLSCNGVFVRKDIAQMFPFEEDRVMASAEDWELWIRLLSRYKLLHSNTITSSVVGHDARSIRSIAADKVIARDLILIDKLANDKAVQQNYGSSFNQFKAERFTFFMLCLAEENRKRDVMAWALKAISTYPSIINSRRFLASLKKVFI